MDEKPSVKLRALAAAPIAVWGGVCLVFGALNGFHALGFISQHWAGEWFFSGRLPGGDDFGLRAMLAGLACLLMGLLWLWTARLVWQARWRRAAIVAGATVVVTLAVGYGLR